MLRTVSLVMLLCLMSCSSGKPGEEQVVDPAKGKRSQATGVAESPPPSVVYSVEIYPSIVMRKSTLTLIPRNFDLANATIEWQVNGVPVPGAADKKIDVVYPKKGDTIQAKVFFQGQEILSNAVTVKNSPPEIMRIKIMPEVFKSDDVLYVDAEAGDVDGDEVAISYEWSINGSPAGTDRRIGKPIKRGDRVRITLTAFDGESYSKPAILQREIRNLPPMIVEDKKFVMKGDLYTYKVKVVDPDGDTLVFALKSAPQGMTIDQDTGMIRWQVPSAFEGKTSFSVSVSDGHGGEAKQDFVFQAGPEARQ